MAAGLEIKMEQYFDQSRQTLQIIQVCRPDLCVFVTPDFTILTKEAVEIERRKNKNISTRTVCVFS